MASDVQKTYFEWKHEQEDSQGPSISQMLDHGSISFGKFALETLSWEKRSVFTHNERLEELEKFKSPGLVAKKKAYFEEYYKKVRALKAMQNQQTVLLLEYGADGSISSQTGDEDEPPFPSTIPNEMPESISEAPLEDLTAEITFEQECSTAFEHEYVASRSVEVATAKEIIEPHSGHYEVKNEENYNNFIQVQISSPLVCSTDPTVSNVVEANFVPVDNPVLEKNKLIVCKLKDGFTSVPMSKGNVTSARHLSKSINKSLPERIKSSLGSKQLHNIIDKAEVDMPLSKKTSNKVRSYNKSSFVPSHRSPTEVQNKVAIPRPNPLSKERKGVIPNNSSELVLRSRSKVSNSSTSRKFNPKGNLRVQGESRETATQNTIISRALQSKSVGHEEFKKSLDSRCGSTVKGRAATEQLRTRSINLPSRNIHDPNRVISYQSGSLSGGDNIKKANASTTRKYEGKSSMINTTRQSGNIKVDTYKKQMSTTEKQERPNGVSKSFIGGLSPDGRKSRKENPRWR
ncbi:hypothetical protein KFK09_023498 [Dendrobium nobile]|uniref:TPX2 C-terminal domain-containing protein n=1 Tax=Dendrobium nobile TaxID=94219 RepID=A0A8T3AC61_DENNO|nr:hypothetical protein KFK09_023498 [Dendrobium nobile]